MNENEMMQLTPDMAREVRSFVDDMIECVDDFIDKLDENYTDVEFDTLYDGEVETLSACDYGDGEYVYPTKAKAKVACKNAVVSAVNDILADYKRSVRNVIAESGDEFRDGIRNDFIKFCRVFNDSFDEYMGLYCSGKSKEYVALMRRKASLGRDNVENSLSAMDLDERFKSTVRELLDNGSASCFDVTELFGMCDYDDDNDSYCYNIDEAIDSINDTFDSYLDDTREQFQEKVRSIYLDTIKEYCSGLKKALSAMRGNNNLFGRTADLSALAGTSLLLGLFNKENEKKVINDLYDCLGSTNDFK